MRCFIAIDISEEVRKEIARIEDEIKSLEDISKLRIVEPKNLHLTLKFLGEIDDKQVNKVKESLKKVKIEKFKVKLNKLGVFTPSYIKVVWIDIAPDKEIKELHERIDESLHKIGIKKDKGFESHITLARVKYVKDKKRFMERIKNIKPKQIEFEIKNFILKKSTLTSNGPIYEDIIKI